MLLCLLFCIKRSILFWMLGEILMFLIRFGVVCVWFNGLSGGSRRGDRAGWSCVAFCVCGNGAKFWLSVVKSGLDCWVEMPLVVDTWWLFGGRCLWSLSVCWKFSNWRFIIGECWSIKIASLTVSLNLSSAFAIIFMLSAICCFVGVILWCSIKCCLMLPE